MAKEKKIDEIKRLCEEKGLSVASVFRTAQIPSSTIANWTRKEPEAFETYEKLKKTINTMSKKETTA